MNEYDILIEIFRCIRDYSTHTYTLPKVLKEVVQYMKDGGYQVDVIDDRHRDYKTIQVEEHRYKLIRYPDWDHFDVQRTN